MKRNFLLVFVTVFVCAMMFCLACGGEDSGDTQKVELEVQLFKNLCTHKAQKYPEDIQSLSKPLKDIGESKANWAFYPFSLKRVDLNKTAKLNYLDNRAGNDKKINFVVREHRQFFEENTVDTLLVSSKMEGVNISEVLNNSLEKPNYFVLSSDDNFKLEGKEVYYSITELQNAISAFLIETKPNKIVVLYQPEMKTAKPVFTNLAPESAKFKQELGSGISGASNWKELYKEAAEHIHPKSFSNSVEHRAGHPEAYSYLVEAAKLAIRSNKSDEILMRLAFDERNKEGLYKIYIGHEADWNAVKNAISSGNVAKLDEVMNFKLELAEEYSKGGKSKKSGHDDDDHDH